MVYLKYTLNKQTVPPACNGFPPLTVAANSQTKDTLPTFHICGVSFSGQSERSTLLQCWPTIGPKHVLWGMMSRAKTPVCVWREVIITPQEQLQHQHTEWINACLWWSTVLPRGSLATEMRRQSGRGRERRARLWMGVSGIKVTGPCSGQSEVYERSHSVHPVNGNSER